MITRSQQRHSTAQRSSQEAVRAGRTKPNALSADYIVGLTDGEGSFTVYLRPPSKWEGSIHYRILCRYYIKMREDELPLLEKVQAFWGCGKIYFQREYRANQRNCYRFEIFDWETLRERVVPFFRAHPLESKRIRDFELFCQVLDLAMRKAHWTMSGIAEIQRLKSQMHA